MGNESSKQDAPTDRAVSSAGRTNGIAQTVMAAPPPSAPLAQAGPPQPLSQRSQTMPNLTQEARLPAQDRERPTLTIDPPTVISKDDDDSKSSICLSPSWDRGKKAKKEKKQLEKELKKQEEVRKEAEKKARNEIEKQRAAANKAGKRDGRLSKKPPPAAMDTQRMPSELRSHSSSRRNSILSILSSNHSSGDSSRRSSRELKRLSYLSTDSSTDQRRSKSTPASSTEIKDALSAWGPVVSGAAPQLPALPVFGLHSHSGSSVGSKSNSWGSEEAYGTELATYANQLNQGSTSPQQQNFARGATQSLQPARVLIRSQTDTALMTISQDQPTIKEVPRAIAVRHRSDDAYQSRVATTRNNHEPQTSMKSRSDLENTQHTRIHPLQANPIQIASSLDGGSYVHKERMRKQQQSLRGFHEEQAVRDATRMLGEQDENVVHEPKVGLPTGREAIFSRTEVEEVPPVPPIPAVPGPASSTELVDQYHSYLKESQDTQDQVILCNPESMPAKKHTFLGMGFRSKPAKQPKESGLIEGMPGSSEEKRDGKPLQPPRLNTSNLKDPTRLSKAERMLGQAPPQTPPSQTPAGRSRLSQAVVDKERSPTGKVASPIQGRSKLANAVIDKESPPRKRETSSVQTKSSTAQDPAAPLVRSHSRTRTSSSQLLNDNESLPRPLPRSTTAPVLPIFDSEPFVISQDETALMGPRNAHKSPKANKFKPSNQADSQPAATGDRSSQAQGSAKPVPEKSRPKPAPELVIEAVTPEGVVRKASLKRPRSNPQLQVTTPDPPVPSLDFLPQLKHQALVKPKPRSHLRNSLITDDETTRPSSSQFPVPAAPMHNGLPPSNNSAPNLNGTPPRSPRRPTSQLSSRSATNETAIPHRPSGPVNRMSTGGRPKGLGKTVAKIIVTCCSCDRWIDLPSDLFKAMAMPARLTKLDGSAATEGEARLDTAVQCPWCAHCMTKHCCSQDTWICNSMGSLN